MNPFGKGTPAGPNRRHGDWSNGRAPTMSRRDLCRAWVTWMLVAAATVATCPAKSQPIRDTLVMGMQLEPTPGLDPTAGAASAIGEVTLYNVFETLTKINEDGSVTPLLAERWNLSPDGRKVAFKLRKGVRFQNGEPFNSHAVKFSFERAAAADSLNKDKAVFANIEAIAAPDEDTVVLHLRHANADLLFQLGQATAVIVEPKSARDNGVRPVGTGPYRLKTWSRGASLVLERWDGYRNVDAIRLRQVQIRFIGDPSAQVAALLAGDIDYFPRAAVSRALTRFSTDSNFQVLVGHSRTKTLLAMNNKRPPLNDVRVRRAIYAAIDRRAVIDGSVDGFGVPIGSFYTTAAPGFVDTTGLNPHDLRKARTLLAEAGIALPLKLSLKVPPVGYAQRGAEVVAGQLVKAGIVVKVETVEWAQWIASVYGQHAYDLTLIAHVEPLDFGNFARPNYYWGYESAAFNELWARITSTTDPDVRMRLMSDAQRLVASDAVGAYLYQPSAVSVAKRKLRGLWTNMPIAANDLASLSW